MEWYDNGVDWIDLYSGEEFRENDSSNIRGKSFEKVSVKVIKGKFV